jgi:transcriptional regulator with XRE-family HTH domain
MRLKELRKLRKLKQIDVAEVLNCSQGVYSRYESGEREPPFDIIKKMADFYGVTVDYLMGADTVEVPAPPPPPKKPDTIAEYLAQLNPENRAFIEEMARKLLASQAKK